MSRKRSPSRRTSSRMRAAVHSTSPRGVRAAKSSTAPSGSRSRPGAWANRAFSRKSRSAARPPPSAARCSTWLGTRRSRAARSSWAAVRRAGEKMPVPPSSSSRWSQVRVTVTEWACSSRRESTSICWGVKSVKPSSHRSLPAAQGQSFSFSAVRVSRSLGSRATWAVRAS